jgi:hypothetical protein
MGGLIGFFSFMIIKKLILESENPIDRSRWLAPVLAFPTFFVLGLALQFKALKGFISRAASEGWIENKYDWLPVKEDGVFDPWADNAWIPINSILLAAFIGAVSSIALYMVLRRIDINEEKRGFRGVERIFCMASNHHCSIRCFRPRSKRPFQCHRPYGRSLASAEQRHG